MDKRNLFGLGFFQFIRNLRRGVFYAYLILFMLEVLKRSFTESILVMALPMLANSLTQSLLWGPLSDKMGKRRIFIALGESIAGVAYVFISPPIWSLITGLNIYVAKALYAYTLIASLTLLESIWSMSNVNWSALIADLTLPEERGNVMGQISSIGALGNIAGVFIGGIVYDYPTKAAGFQYIFFIASICLFLSAVIILTFVSEEKSISPRIIAKMPSSDSRLMKPYLFYSFLVSLAFVIVGRASIRRIMNYYLRLAILASSFEMSIINNAGTISRLIFSPLLGYLSDKKGREIFIELGFILAVFVPLLYVSFNTITLLVIVSIINGFVMSIINTVAYAYVAAMIPEKARGKYFGQYNLVRSISSGVIPILSAGFLLDFLVSMYLSRGISFTSAQLNAMIDIFYLASILALIGTALFTLLNVFRRK